MGPATFPHGRVKALGFGRDPRHAALAELSLVHCSGMFRRRGLAWTASRYHPPSLGGGQGLGSPSTAQLGALAAGTSGRTGFAGTRAASVHVCEWTCFEDCLTPLGIQFREHPSVRLCKHLCIYIYIYIYIIYMYIDALFFMYG